MRRHRRPSTGRVLTTVGVAFGAALVVAGIWGVAAHRTHLPGAGPPPPVPTARAVAVTTPSSPSSATTAATTTTVTTTTAVSALPSGATRVEIPSLTVAAQATAVDLTADGLGVPDNPATLGWWMPQPSVLVIDGHVDSAVTGPGALFELRTLKPGSSIIIDTPSQGTEYWKLDGLRTYTKGQLPASLFDQPGPRLVIVTCGGPFDDATHHYYDNVVAYASPRGPGG